MFKVEDVSSSHCVYLDQRNKCLVIDPESSLHPALCQSHLHRRAPEEQRLVEKSHCRSWLMFCGDRLQRTKSTTPFSGDRDIINNFSAKLAS